ncbi:MAG: hypothetical protein M3367_06890 [Acidobacteriota bacterium]|nr:hypothetical protein [Acidobacteriota bacterium]
MTKRVGNSTGVKPLTKRTKQRSELYLRRSEVERQIAKVLSLADRQIFELLENRQRDSAGFLLDETIVYLLRERKDDNFFVEILYAELNKRIWKLFRKFYKNFNNEADFEDFGQKIEMEIIKKIFDLESDASDYAQVNFGDYVVKTAKVVWRGRLANITRENEMFETERARDEDESKADENRFVFREISTEEKMILQARLAALPDNIRNAAILHYLDGWQIESKDAHAPTISKLFDVSSRTIRNWLTEARTILAAQEGELRR